mgnify:CR=1 FL=1
MPGHYGGSSSGKGSPHAGTAGSTGHGGPDRGGGGGADRDPQPVSQPTYTPPARHHAVDTPTQIQEQKVADEINRQNEMRDLIVQQQQEKDYIDIIDRNYATDFDETPQATLEGQLKLDEYQEPSGILDSAVGLGLNMILPGAGYLYNLESNPYKASNFFAGTGIQDLDRQALLSGYLSPEDAAAYQAGTYGQPTGGGEGVQPTVIGGGGPDVMPITMAQTIPTGINTIPVNNNLIAGYTDQQDFMDNVYRQNLLDFFKGTGYTGLYG